MHAVVGGLVIRSVDYRESDKILTVLTDRLGKLTVSARGARRRGSQAGARVENGMKKQKKACGFLPL